MCRVKNCNNTENYIHNFCKNCWEKYPSTFDKQHADKYVKIYLKHCNLHGYFISASTKSICPVCINMLKEFENNNAKLSLNEIKSKFKIIESYKNKETNSAYIIVNTPYGDYLYKNCINCNLWSMTKDHISRKIEGIKGGMKNFCDTTCMDFYQHKNNNFKYKCKKCGTKLLNPSQKCPNCGYNLDKDKNYVCEKCGGKLTNNLQICPNCGYRRITIFHCVNCGEIIKNPTSTCNKCGYKNPNIVGFSPLFITKDNVLYYYDKSSKSYIPWEDYKAKFSRIRVNYDISIFIEKLKSLEIFQPKHMGPVDSYDLNDIIQLVPTFRTQDSNSWEGSKQAFEQSLVEKGVNWFAYVKFYIDNKKKTVRPLVVGKSGSLNVNSSGSDLSFSESSEDGPARRFLNETNNAWDKTQVLIIKAKSESQSLYYEWYIQKFFRLFES